MKVVGVLENITDKVLPDKYFQPEREEIHIPRAPRNILHAFLIAELVAAFALFVFFMQYYIKISNIETTISSKWLKDQDCNVLNPLIGTKYYSNITSENAQVPIIPMNNEL